MKKVLFVEDEEDLREMMSDALAHRGYEVGVAATGAEAIAAMRDATEFTHLITDVSMPGGVSGIDLAEAVIEAHPEVRVIVASGYQKAQLPPLPPQARFLQKPYRMHQLFAALED